MDERKQNEVALRFGALLRSARLQRNLTQVEAAKMLDVSQSFYNRVESGQRNVDFPTAVKICRVFDLDLNEFANSVEP